MSSYKLCINFTGEALKIIYLSNEKIILTKVAAENMGTPVVWVATLPFLSNTIEWSGDYKLYASGEAVDSGVNIKKMSDTMAMPGLVHDFSSDGFQDARSAPGVRGDEYVVHNAMNQYLGLTFGLAQDVTANGETKSGNPINALVLPYNHTAFMTPVEKVRIFLANAVDEGNIMLRQYENGIEVEFHDNETEKSITYDCGMGKFILDDN